MAYTIARRTREIGIRTALGAPENDVRRLVMEGTVLIVGIGLSAGFPFGADRRGSCLAQLFGLTPADLATILAAFLMLLLVAVVAAYFPVQIDAAKALRHE